MDLQHFNSQRADSLFKKKIKKKSMNSYQDYFFPCSVELKKIYGGLESVESEARPFAFWSRKRKCCVKDKGIKQVEKEMAFG